jgi:hypothetical protein
LPEGAAAGDYAFRLNVFSEDNPDDDYAKGPAVAFTVAGLITGKQVVVARRLQWGRIILSGVLSAIVSLAIILIGTIMIGNKPTKVSPSGNPAGDFVGVVVGTLLRALLWFLLYFPLASLLSALFTMLLVQYRRLIHTALSLVVSLPIAIVLLWLVSLLTK